MSTKWTQTLKKSLSPFGRHRPLRKEHSPKVYVHKNENNVPRSLSFCLQTPIRTIISTNNKPNFQKEFGAFLNYQTKLLKETTVSYLDQCLSRSVFTTSRMDICQLLSGLFSTVHNYMACAKTMET